MGSSHSLMDTKFSLRLQSREAQKLNVKCLKEEEMEKLKVKAALEKGNAEAARIHAANSIRKHNEAIRYLQYQAKIDTLINQVDSAMRTHSVTTDLKKALPHLNKIVHSKSMDSVNIFHSLEKLFQNLEVHDSYVNQIVDSESSYLTPIEDVDNLITKVAEEHALDIGDMLSQAGAIISPIPSSNTSEAK